MTVVVSCSTQQSRRNNHLHMHRHDLRDAVKGLHPPVCLLALNCSLDLPHVEVHRICADHVLTRGTNHQTLHGDEHGKYESVIWRFLLDDDEADTMDVREALEQALSSAVDAVVRVLDLPHADAEQVSVALGKARGYHLVLTDAQQQPQKKKGSAAPRYFAFPTSIVCVADLSSTNGKEIENREARVRHVKYPIDTHCSMDSSLVLRSLQ